MHRHLRTTPYAIWRYGAAYRKAAIVILAQHQGQQFLPYYFLAGQSIELLLKAFLFGRGVDLGVLRNQYGHNLSSLLKEARRRKLGNEIKLTPRDVGVIDLLNLEYKSRRFQYHEAGLIHLPIEGFLDSANEKIMCGIEQHCKDTSHERRQRTE